MLSYIRDTEIENLLKDYSRPIFRAAGLGSGRVTMRIIRHDSYNAFVLDGSNVFIHTGTLQQADTPNQVIGVIAHEAGHIAGGHLAQLRERIARDQTKSLLIKLLGIGLMVAGGGGGGTGAGAGVMMGGDELLMRSLLADRRAQEFVGRPGRVALPHHHAAVRPGHARDLRAVRAAGVHLGLRRHQDAFARSHPVAANRLAQLRDAVAKSPFANEKDPARCSSATT